LRFVGYFVYQLWAQIATALELPTASVNPCVLSIVIATLLQRLTDLKKNRLPNFEGGSLGFWQRSVMLDIFA
jgi:hypothetical protein